MAAMKNGSGIKLPKDKNKNPLTADNPCAKINTVLSKMYCASGSVVEYRLAKARVAGSNPVSRSLKPLIFQGFLFLCCTACCSRECRKAQIFIFLEKTIDIFVIL